MTTLWHSSINHWSVTDEFHGSAEKSCRELFCCCSSCSVDRQDAKFHRFTWLSSLIGFCNHFLGLASTSHFPRKKGMTFGHHVTLWYILHALGVILGLNDGREFLAVICFVDELSACVKKNCNDHHLIIYAKARGGRERMMRWCIEPTNSTRDFLSEYISCLFYYGMQWPPPPPRHDEISLISLYILFHSARLLLSRQVPCSWSSLSLPVSLSGSVQRMTSSAVLDGSACCNCDIFITNETRDERGHSLVPDNEHSGHRFMPLKS